MEGRNDVQKKRSVGRSLMNSLHFTYVQPAMQHVRQAYQASEFGPAHGDQGVRSTMPNEVNMLVQFFVDEIGVPGASIPALAAATVAAAVAAAGHPTH